MNDFSFYLNKAKSFALEAKKYEAEERYDEACSLYIKAAEQLKTLMKYDQNEYAKEAYKKKAIEYGLRAKDIKEGRIKKIIEPIDGNNKGSGTDKEDTKINDALSGCLVSDKPNVKWSDVAGLEKAKEALKEAVILPLNFPQLFEGKRKPWKGILLYGPPGTGKSFLAKAAATETGGKFFSISAANIVSKFMGESERTVKSLFDMARKNKPAVIFLDEIDSVMSARSENENDATRRLKTEFLVQMQGVGKDDDGILVLGATNIPWGLDPAVRRRFQKKIYISLPEFEARKHMFQLNLGNTPNNITEDQFNILAKETEGFSGSDIATLTQDAIYEPLRKCEKAQFFKKVNNQTNTDYNYIPCDQKDLGASKMTMLEIPEKTKLLPPKVCFNDYMEAKKKIKPTVCEADLKQQEQFTLEFGQEG